ncbi:MAG: phosphoribosylformylglycinamidine cyclo-ligase, partial [Salinibacterium sp.]|nr:phosphoribosylformylglycinamidine cyclo-ligase [Salinibacterium sp.]
DTIGIDLVGMNVNDLIVEGAEPLFFLDILSVPQVEPGVMAALMAGVAEGCRRAGCALLGGETAEMGDLYAPGDFDLNGFAVGVVELKRAMSARRPSPGDVILGLGSSGPHSNGFTLIRAILKTARLKLDKHYPELEAADGSKPTLGEALLEPTRLYPEAMAAIDRAYPVKRVVSAMADITGGGLADNLARSLGDKVDAKIDWKAWPVPPVFKLLQSKGNVDTAEMRRVFNMGIGYVMVVKPKFAQAVAQHLREIGQAVYIIGEIVEGKGRVR